MEQRTCPECGEPAAGKGKPRKPTTYCSPLCQRRGWRRRRIADGHHRERLDAVNAREAAVRAAGRAANARPCQYCGVLMSNPQRKQCGAAECEQKLKAEQVARTLRRAREIRERTGKWPSQVNGKPEHRERSNATGAAKRAARQAAGLPAHPWTETRKAADQRRRAAKRGATTEKFTPLEIFERDGWRCGICGRKVGRDLAYPHPKSASLDHVEPLSRGGEHSRANARLAHLDCNVQRGNRGCDEQLLLIG